MFILRNKYNQKVTDGELLDIITYASELGINIRGVEFYKNTQLSYRNNVACFSLLYSNTVFFCDDNSITGVFPAIAHELKHREQFKRMGWIRYMLLAFPLWRKWTIEPEAYAEQDRVNILLEIRNNRSNLQ